MGFIRLNSERLNLNCVPNDGSFGYGYGCYDVRIGWFSTPCEIDHVPPTPHIPIANAPPATNVHLILYVPNFSYLPNPNELRYALNP